MRLQKQNFLESFREIQITANNSISQVLSIKTPEVSTICRGTGSKENGYDLYKMVILMILDFYDIDWSKDHISECAQMLYDDYYWFTLAELKHFALMCKSAKFGKVYGKINPVTLIDWAGQYAEISLEERERSAYNKAQDERYNERWNTHDARKAGRTGEMYLNAEINQIKDNLKNNDNASNKDV